MTTQPPNASAEPGNIEESLGAILREVGGLSKTYTELQEEYAALDVKVGQMNRSLKRLADDRIQDRFDLDRYGRRLQQIEHQVALISQRPDLPDWQPDPKEVTGTHDFEVIRAQFEEWKVRQKEEESRRKDSILWWRRQRWLWAVAFIFLIASASLGACATIVVSKILAGSSVSK